MNGRPLISMADAIDALTFADELRPALEPAREPGDVYATVAIAYQRAGVVALIALANEVASLTRATYTAAGP